MLIDLVFYFVGDLEGKDYLILLLEAYLIFATFTLGQGSLHRRWKRVKYLENQYRRLQREVTELSMKISNGPSDPS